MLPESRSTTGGIVKSLLLLGAAMLGAAAAGYLILLGLWQLWPELPAWTGLAVLVVILVAYSRRFKWLMPWYYVMPAILFLLTFTFFPVALTFWLAFTDYAGVRNGQLNISSTTPIVEADGNAIVVSDPRILNCSQLRDGCNDVRALVYSARSEEHTSELQSRGHLVCRL